MTTQNLREVLSRAFAKSEFNPELDDHMFAGERADEGDRLADVAIAAMQAADFIIWGPNLLETGDGAVSRGGGASPSAAGQRAAAAPSSTSPDAGAATPPAQTASPDAATSAPGAAESATAARTAESAPPSVLPRPFLLFRKRDITGLSGEGVVAWGVQFPDGTAALRWNTAHPATACWPSVEDIVAVHGHQGATVVRWLDGGE